MEEFDIRKNKLVNYNGNAEEVIIPEGVEKINRAVFNWKAVKRVVLPSSMKTISQAAFLNSHIESIVFNEGLLYIGDYAFRGCTDLKSVEIPSSVKELGYKVFENCFSLERVIFSEGLEVIGRKTFKSCRSLNFIHMPLSVRSCPKSAFIECRNLKIKEGFKISDRYLISFSGSAEDVTIPDDVETIGEEAFYYRGEIKTVTIPASVKKIMANAFNHCSSLEQVIFADGANPEISSSAFMNCAKLNNKNGFALVNGILSKYTKDDSKVIVPEQTKVIGANAFEDKQMSQIIFPEGLQKIGEWAFFNCKSLKSVTIPASVKEIEECAFYDCCSLKQVVFSEGLEKIRKSAFSNCKSLKSITIPASVKEIEKSAFYNCGSLEQVGLLDGLEKIGELAFSDCESLKAVTIPASVKEIGKLAFHGCKSLSIIFEGALPNFGDRAFIGVDAIYAPQASVSDFLQCKEAYLIGFVRLLQKNVGIDCKIVEENNHYIKNNVKKFYDAKNEEMFMYILQNKWIPLKDVDELIAKFGEKKDVVRVAALIDYKEKNFTEKQRERQFNKQFELKEPTEFAKLKKLWAFSKKEDGTYRISAYKGEDEKVIVPATIKGVQVTEIGNGKACFFSESLCKTVKSITLPEGIKTIGKRAFCGCKALEEVDLPEGLERIGLTAFSDCTSLKKITIPASVREIIDSSNIRCGGVFSNCKSLEQVVLSEGLEKIGVKAFEKCISLKMISIPSSVKHIGDSAFSNCKSLEQVVLSEGLEAIEDGAFSACKSIKSISIPASVKHIGHSAFFDCKSLKQVVLSEGLEMMGSTTFWECKRLKTITIPASVKIMGFMVFIGCPNITVYCRSEEKPAEWSNDWDKIDWQGGRAKVVWGYKGE